MRTVIQRRQILFVDGLPGSGKSTAAAEIGRRCPDSRVFREMHPNHPLLVGVPDRGMGAAFGTIHEVHTADSFATMALEKLDAFLEEAGSDVRYVFESHPLQSTVRVLFQLDAPSKREASTRCGAIWPAPTSSSTTFDGWLKDWTRMVGLKKLLACALTQKWIETKHHRLTHHVRMAQGESERIDPRTTV